MIANNIAPGLHRDYFGFSGWLGHDESLWQSVLSKAKSAVTHTACILRGTDKDRRAIAIAKENAQLAGVEESVQFSVSDLFHANFNLPNVIGSTDDCGDGLLVTNPPYGERLVADAAFYESLGGALSRHFAGWRCAVFTATAAPMKQARLPLKSELELRNGSIDCGLFEGNIPTSSVVRENNRDTQKIVSDDNGAETENVVAGSAVWATSTSGSVSSASNASVSKAEDHIDIQAFVNRVRKNAKKLKSWQKRESISAWRTYDADLPEFAVAIDIYDCGIDAQRERHVVVQEYQAPATVNAAMAEARLNAILKAVPDCLETNPDNVHLKVRQKHSRESQYQKQNSTNVSGVCLENGYQLQLNFSDYLDTGLFLDHRKLRSYVQQQAKGKRFLNLFCYTGSVTVAAASGGASASVSLDLSKRYTEWLQRNLRLNKLASAEHEVIRADVIDWLKNYKGPQFDLIFLDPPTFSNSTDVENDWNLQRDHGACIRACMDMLSEKGTLVFSNNFRRFKLDTDLPYRIEDKSRWSIDMDFQRNARIHQCWFIKHT